MATGYLPCIKLMFIDIIEIDTFISFSSLKKINAFEFFFMGFSL